MYLVRPLGLTVVLALMLCPLTGCGGNTFGGTFNKWFGLQSSSDLDLGEDAPQALARQAQELMDADAY